MGRRRAEADDVVTDGQESATSAFSRKRAFNRWAVAARLDAVLPQLRGRDRLLAVVRGRVVPRPLRGPVTVTWGPKLSATIDPSVDGSFAALYQMQWVEPALAPILEVCLRPGDLFVDVGANIGIYATWAARLVGPNGHVIAAEPVEQTREWLHDICVQNAIDNIEILSCAIGARPGTTLIKSTPGASGLSSAFVGSGPEYAVPVATLDGAVGDRNPRLMKIDVEGGELDAFRGATDVLTRARPVVVFEAPEFGTGSGTAECVALLASVGYDTFSLSPVGLTPFGVSDHSHNLVSIHSDDTQSKRLLATIRFVRNQNV